MCGIPVATYRMSYRFDLAVRIIWFKLCSLGFIIGMVICNLFAVQSFRYLKGTGFIQYVKDEMDLKYRHIFKVRLMRSRFTSPEWAPASLTMKNHVF